MKYTVVKEDWTTEFETDSQEVIDNYINSFKDTIFQVLYRERDDYPLHVYYMK